MSPVTEPGNLAYPGRTGDVEETAITNDASNKGFPARTQGGELVFIVKKHYEDGVKVLTANDGSKYVDDQVLGFLVPYSSEEIGEEELPIVGGEPIEENAEQTLQEAGPDVSAEADQGTQDPVPSVDEAGATDTDAGLDDAA